MTEVVYIQWNITLPKKEWNNAINSNIDEKGDYHTKWSKSDKDEYMLSLTCVIQNMTQINLFTKQKQTNRHRKQTYGYQGEGGVNRSLGLAVRAEKCHLLIMIHTMIMYGERFKIESLISLFKAIVRKELPFHQIHIMLFLQSLFYRIIFDSEVNMDLLKRSKQRDNTTSSMALK